MNVIDILGRTTFSSKETIYDSEKARVVLFSLEDGQGVGPHTIPTEVALLVVDGNGVFITGDGEKKVSKGDLLVCKGNEPHGIRAEGRMIVLAVVTK